jgi:hypothetical protein
MMRKTTETLMIVLAALCLMGAAYTQIPNETGVQLRSDVNARFSGAQPISPSLTTQTITTTESIVPPLATYYNCDATSAAVGIGLAADATGSGRLLVFKKIDASGHTCTIFPQLGANTIDGSINVVLSAQYQWVTIVDAAPLVWSVISSTSAGSAVSGDLSGSLPSPTVATVLGGHTPMYLTETGAQLQNLTSVPGQAASATISNFSINGVFNVKDPKYGAKGDGSTCDQTAIQSAINAAEAAPISSSPPLFPVVYFPQGQYKVGCNTPAVPLTVSGSAVINGLKLLGDGPNVSRIASSGRTPTLFFEPLNYYSSVLGNNAFSTVTFGGGSVTALNWNTAASATRYLNFKDLNQGTGEGAGSFFGGAKMAAGNTDFDIQFFFQFPSGLANGTYELFNSAGNDGINSASFMDIHMVQGTSNNTFAGTLNLSDGSHGISAALSNSTTLTPNVIHFAELNLDSASNTVNFFLDGTKVNTSVSVTGGATTAQIASEQWLIGCAALGVWGDNTSCSTHWVGQIFGIRISEKAYNTANYTAPTALLAVDGTSSCGGGAFCTKLLMNGTQTQDVWIQPESLWGGFGSMPWHTTQLEGGNISSIVQNLALLKGTYGILNFGALYLNLIDLNVNASEAPIHYENNSYGGTWRGLQIGPAAFAESGIELFHNAGITSVDDLIMPGVSYYGLVLVDSPMTDYGGSFMGVGSNTIAAISAYGDTIDANYTFMNVHIDNEAASPLACYQISGSGTYVDIGSVCETAGTHAPVQWWPINHGSVTFLNSVFNTEGGSPAEILNYNGSSAFDNPTLFSQVSVNGHPLTNQAIPICSDMTKCSAQGLGAVPALTTVSGLPTCASGTLGLEGHQGLQRELHQLPGYDVHG